MTNRQLIKKRKLASLATFATAATAALLSLGWTAAPSYALSFLSSGDGDGSLSVTVDGYGSFGSSVEESLTDAIYDPVGESGPAGTTFESGVAIGLPGMSGRNFLSIGSIGSSGGLQNIETVTNGLLTSTTSSFSFESLLFNLTQTLTPLRTGSDRTGTVLTQEYQIRLSPDASEPVEFDLVRYLDGDLDFDGSISDGGGRLSDRTSDILFETDSANGANNANTFVGITAEGGSTTSLSGRFEISEFSGLVSKVVEGESLNDDIQNDSDGDQFIDEGAEYDVTLALLNAFSLSPNDPAASYLTQTIFGSGEPGENTPGSSETFPLLPTVTEPDGTFIFTDVPSGVWFDPPAVEGFAYQMLSNSLFTSIVDFPTGFADPFTVAVGDTVLGQFGPGQSVDFAALVGNGVSAFTVSGINPLVEEGDPNAFPIQLAFNTATASFSMRPLLDTSSEKVPTPALLPGLIGLGATALRKRKRENKVEV